MKSKENTVAADEIKTENYFALQVITAKTVTKIGWNCALIPDLN